MTPSQLASLERFKILTAGSFDPYVLSGPKLARIRQEIMTALNGDVKVPRVDCGVISMREMFYRLVQPEGNSMSAPLHHAIDRNIKPNGWLEITLTCGHKKMVPDDGKNHFFVRYRCYQCQKKEE